MMPRKRRNTVVQPVADQLMGGVQIFRTGLYGRLSVLNNGKPDGDSLESQISLMEEYVSKRPYLHYVKLYQDNGYTGTNFSRPAWDELLRDVKAGKINCIVVKDLSRLGRNYIEAGEFLEKECPQLGIRFISINDDYDSLSLNSTEELTAALKNIINDYYAKDISRKSCSALAIKRHKGEYVGSYAPYGYQKDPADKNHLLIDPVTAPVVRQIYEWRAAGDGYGMIARRLNEQGIPSPGRYRYEQGIITNNNKKGSKLLWNRHVLTDILKDPVYIGHLAQGKCRASLYQGIPAHTVPKTEWEVSRHTHDVLLPNDLFQAVQCFNERQSAVYSAQYGKYADLPKETNPYRDRLVCADCGAQLKLRRSFSIDRKQVYYSYLCPTYEEHRELGCTKKSIRSHALDAAVLSAAKVQMKLFLDAGTILSALNAKRQSPREAMTGEDRYASMERQIARKESLCASLYADWKSGILTYEEYCFAKERYTRETAALKQQLNEFKSMAPHASEQIGIAARWAEKLQAYQDAESVTEELVDAMISYIRLNSDGEVTIQFSFEQERQMIERELKRLREGAA